MYIIDNERALAVKSFNRHARMEWFTNCTKTTFPICHKSGMF